MVSQRWLKIREQYDSPVVAIVRQTGGVLKFLNVEAWRVFISEKADGSVLSVHCFINGENHQVYRNKFTVKDKLGRYVCSTHVYNFPLSKEAPDCVVTMYDSKIKLLESRANQIKNIMDLATNTVVRYVESMLQMRILDLTVDYVIDKKSQIWMLWAPDSKFVRTTSLKDVELPNMLDKKGRASWMGDKYFESLEAREQFEQQQQKSGGYKYSSEARALSPSSHVPSFSGAYSPERSRAGASTTAGGAAGGGMATSSPTHHPVTQVYHTFADETDRHIPLHVTTTQVNDATNAPVIAKAQSQRKRVNDNESTSAYNVTQQYVDVSEVTGQFPHPFKCKGDYCNFIVTPAGALSANAERASEHIVQKLFTAKEIEQLRKDKNYSQMMEFESAGPALAVLTMRSILLARQERRGLDAGNGEQPWNTYPDSPRGKIKFRPDAPAVAHLDNDKNGIKTKEQMVGILSYRL